jgi:hypothetical protein
VGRQGGWPAGAGPTSKLLHLLSTSQRPLRDPGEPACWESPRVRSKPRGDGGKKTKLAAPVQYRS